MGKIWQYASYHLLSLFSAPVGQESFHCDMKRGFAKARKKDPSVKALLEQDTEWQTIGLLAQKGVYEFHKNPQFLEDAHGIDRIANILELQQEKAEIHTRVKSILENYYNYPILSNKEIIQLSRGDQGFPKPLLLHQGDYYFNFYAAIDCIFREPDGTLHILDLKTGKADFDFRQAYLYLLAASYLYPREKAVASFYNLETCKWSQPLKATPEVLQFFQVEMSQIAKQHQQELKLYWNHPEKFDEIYTPNPGFRCKYCQFASICQFSNTEFVA